MRSSGALKTPHAMSATAAPAAIDAALARSHFWNGKLLSFDPTDISGHALALRRGRDDSFERRHRCARNSSRTIRGKGRRIKPGRRLDQLGPQVP
jgi:hypothetical protein